MSVSYLDIAKALGKPHTAYTQDRIIQLNWWIKVAQTKIRQRCMLERIAFEDLDPDAVDVVVVESVCRKVANPKGKQNERIDDYSYGINPAEATSQITITDDEWRMLTPAREAGAFMIRTDLGTSAHHGTYRGW